MTKVKTRAKEPKEVKAVKEKKGKYTKKESKDINYGGKRENSGRKSKLDTLRKLGVVKMIEEHSIELIPVTVTVTTQFGYKKEVTVEMPATLAVLCKLRDMGMAGNWQALDKWLCHTLGAPKVRLTNGEGDGPVQFTGIDIVVRE
jgi:hypothetical protein